MSPYGTDMDDKRKDGQMGGQDM